MTVLAWGCPARLPWPCTHPTHPDAAGDCISEQREKKMFCFPGQRGQPLGLERTKSQGKIVEHVLVSAEGTPRGG